MIRMLKLLSNKCVFNRMYVDQFKLNICKNIYKHLTTNIFMYSIRKSENIINNSFEMIKL